METIDPQGVGKFDPRGMKGTIYMENHYPLPHTKSVGLVVSEKKSFDFFSFFIKTHVAVATKEFQSNLPQNRLVRNLSYCSVMLCV